MTAVPRPPAPLGRRVLSVSSSRAVGAYTVLTVADPDGPTPIPGQFYMLAAAARWGAGVDERPFLPRAFSVMRVDAQGGLEFMLEDVGPGTNRLCELGAKEEVAVLGPLGNGFGSPLDGRRSILCGGGVGTAPLAILQDRRLHDGERQVALLGFRDEPHALGAALLRDARVATDDGSVGHHGLVTELLDAELDADDHAVVYACGPPPMLEAVRALCEAREVPSELALESGMACGFGACFGCVVPVREGGYVRLCVDGPVLAGSSLQTALVAGAGH